MYISAKYLNIKLLQDDADFINNDSDKALIICDGIGEFQESGKASKLVVERFIDAIQKQGFSIQNFIHKVHEELQELKIVGGTTLICAHQSAEYEITIHYLGNGGVIHFYGDFATNPYSERPYRFIDIMNPHMNPKGSLTKHISHTSGQKELVASTVKLQLNSPQGDILLFFTDGISSLEDKAIMITEQGDYWRFEKDTIQIILTELDNFLLKNCSDLSMEKLNDFLKSVLLDLNSRKKLDDDASLGIILTEEVLELYKIKTND